MTESLPYERTGCFRFDDLDADLQTGILESNNITLEEIENGDYWFNQYGEFV